MDFWSITIDGDGTKWIGTYLGGLTKYDGTNWTTYNGSNSGLPIDNSVHSTAIDGNRNKWIGNIGGLTKYDGTNWTTFTMSNSGLPDNFVLSLNIDSRGTKWIGTWDGGLSVYNENGVPFSICENVLTENRVKVFPNPSLTNITIENNSRGSLSILNINGKQLITRQITETEAQIDISNLPSGMYFVRLTSGKSVEVGKFVKH